MPVHIYIHQGWQILPCLAPATLLHLDLSSNGSNGYTEVQSSATATTNPDAAAVTQKWLFGGRVYSEFDTWVNENFALRADFTDGSGGVDRASVLRHEFGHGCGLDHSSNSSNLMYAEPDLSFVRNVDVDMQRGYRCLYQNVDCQYDEDSPGSIDEKQY
jgi:hypothetical protein